MDEALRETTRKTARMLFHSIKGGAGFDTWKKFDKDLARELSMFFTGKLYSREVISQKQRELCAVASLTVLHRRHEIRAHVHAALNVGATRAGGRRGDLPAGHLRRHAGRRRGARGLQGGAGGAGRVGGVTAGSPHPALAAAVEAARAAGEIALRYYRGGFQVTIKPDQTPVTQADREAEQTITRILGQRFPTGAFSGRSSARRGPRRRAGSSIPIDGTKNFVRGIPFWAVLIALEERGEITAGVVFNPVTDELFTARRGGGAYLNGARIAVSGIAAMRARRCCTPGFDSCARPGTGTGVARLVDASGRSRGFGDYYGYGLVAAGKAEVYVEVDLKPWDVAPVKILVEEAGGRLTDFSGPPDDLRRLGDRHQRAAP